MVNTMLATQQNWKSWFLVVVAEERNVNIQYFSDPSEFQYIMCAPNTRTLIYGTIQKVTVVAGGSSLWCKYNVAKPGSSQICREFKM